MRCQGDSSRPIHGWMIPRFKYVAAQETALTWATVRRAPVASIEQWSDTAKGVVSFFEPGTAGGRRRRAASDFELMGTRGSASRR